MSKRIAITGVTGYLGGSLAKAYSARGHKIISVGRKLPRNTDIEFDNHIEWTLESAEEIDLRNIDVLVHTAWDMKITSSDLNEKINVKGSDRLLEAALDQGVPRIIFVSTTSASAAAATTYGKSKFKLETKFRDAGVVIVRPGLIFGDTASSMMGTLEKLIQLLPLVPVVGANSIFYLSHICDLSDAIVSLSEDLAKYRHEKPVLASSRSYRFGELLRMIATKNSKKRYFIPVPWKPIYFLMRMVESLGLKLPVKSDSLLSLMTLPVEQPINESFKFREFGTPFLREQNANTSY